MALGTDNIYCPSGTLWYTSGDPRLWSVLPYGHPLVGGPLGTLWSDALWAPSGLPDFKFYDDLFYIDYKYKGPRRKKRVPQNIH